VANPVPGIGAIANVTAADLWSADTYAIVTSIVDNPR
jgi:hypothetical protein